MVLRSLPPPQTLPLDFLQGPDKLSKPSQSVLPRCPGCDPQDRCSASLGAPGDSWPGSPRARRRAPRPAGSSLPEPVCEAAQAPPHRRRTGGSARSQAEAAPELWSQRFRRPCRSPAPRVGRRRPGSPLWALNLKPKEEEAAIQALNQPASCTGPSPGKRPPTKPHP